MKLLQILNLLVCSAILVLIIYFHVIAKNIIPQKDLWNEQKISAKEIKAIKSQEIPFATAKGVMDKLRDTLEKSLGSKYIDLHTGGVRFSFLEIKDYMETILKKAQDAHLSDDSIRNLSVYICPGIYPKGSVNPTTRIDCSNKLTSILFVPLKGRDIFDRTSHKLIIGEDMFLTAYNWGSLEP